MFLRSSVTAFHVNPSRYPLSGESIVARDELHGRRHRTHRLAVPQANRVAYRRPNCATLRFSAGTLAALKRGVSRRAATASFNEQWQHLHCLATVTPTTWRRAYHLGGAGPMRKTRRHMHDRGEILATIQKPPGNRMEPAGARPGRAVTASREWPSRRALSCGAAARRQEARLRGREWRHHAG